MKSTMDKKPQYFPSQNLKNKDVRLEKQNQVAKEFDNLCYQATKRVQNNKDRETK